MICDVRFCFCPFVVHLASPLGSKSVVLDGFCPDVNTELIIQSNRRASRELRQRDVIGRHVSEPRLDFDKILASLKTR